MTRRTFGHGDPTTEPTTRDHLFKNERAGRVGSPRPHLTAHRSPGYPCCVYTAGVAVLPIGYILQRTLKEGDSRAVDINEGSLGLPI
jgi:hypothetical protein